MPAPTTRSSTPATIGTRRRNLLDGLVLSAVTILLRLPAYFAPKHLSFDDGVFASSVIAMRDGGAPFRDVFSSQGPLFLPLAYLGDLVGFRTIDSPRVLAVLSGVVIVLGVYWTALQFTDRVGALVAGGLAATSGSLMWVTGPLAADGPALAFVVLTLGLTLRLRDHPTYWRAALVGLSLGATLSTKALEAPVLLPVALVLAAPVLNAARRHSFDVVAVLRGLVAGAAATFVFLAISAPFGFADVWDQSFRYRTDAAADKAPSANAGKLISTLWDRDLVLLLFCAVALAAGVLAYRRTGSARVTEHPEDASSSSQRPGNGDAGPDQGAEHPTAQDPPEAAPRSGWLPSSRLLVTSWAILSALWLIVVVSPLWRPHVSAMALPLVLLVALYRPPIKVVLIAAICSVPLLVVQLDGLLAPDDYTGAEAEIVAALRELPDGAWVLSDEPGLVWRAGRRTTDDLVDTSMLRVQQGRYTEKSLADAAADPRVCAVVVRSEDRFGYFPGLGDRLRVEGYEVTLRPTTQAGDDQRLYVRSDCDPTI